MVILNLARFHRVEAVADHRVITNPEADPLLTQNLALDHFLVHRAAMEASIKAVPDTLTPDHAPGHVLTLEIAGVVIVAILVVLVQDVADM